MACTDVRSLFKQKNSSRRNSKISACQNWGINGAKEFFRTSLQKIGTGGGKEMVDQKKTNVIIIRKQCQVLGLNRSSYYYKPQEESPENLDIMRRMDGLYLKYPFYGSRKMVLALKQQGINVCRDRIRRLMNLMGVTAIYQKPNTSQKNPEHKIYPYLLKDLTIDRPNQVWATDITYVPTAKGFMYLVAVVDWYSRKILSWRLSNSLDSYFCREALKKALAKHPNPDIFNTDQGCQFTSREFTKVLKDHGIQISTDGKGRWRDNVMIERFLAIL